MQPCTHCGTLVAATRCPTCNTLVTKRGLPKRWAVLGLSLLAGCVEPTEQIEALYGVPCTDDDADGYCMEGDDCNDSDDTVFPGAQEIAGDGIDSDCDGEDDPPPEQ